MKYKIRNVKTGEWVCYGATTWHLETRDRKTADELVGELADYNIDAVVVELPEPPP